MSNNVQHFGRAIPCECPSRGIGSKRCDVTDRTCQPFLTYTETRPRSGVYSITHRNGSRTEVFCDFDSEPQFGWTLVRSFSIPSYPQVTRFLDDFEGINEMAKKDMIYLGEDSTHWRATCKYEKGRLDYVDYLGSSFAETDPLLYSSFSASSVITCRKLDYVNIRGRRCTHCTFSFHRSFSATSIQVILAKAVQQIKASFASADIRTVCALQEIFDVLRAFRPRHNSGLVAEMHLYGIGKLSYRKCELLCS